MGIRVVPPFGLAHTLHRRPLFSVMYIHAQTTVLAVVLLTTPFRERIGITAGWRPDDPRPLR
jgi:hypothetical protein